MLTDIPMKRFPKIYELIDDWLLQKGIIPARPPDWRELRNEQGIDSP